MIKSSHLSSIACALLLGMSAAHADSQYVTDEFEITMRSGQGASNAIIKILPTGTQLEVLELEETGKYAHVQTSDGKEGWVLARYLIDKPIAKIRLEAAQNRIKSMRNDIASLKKELDDLKADNSQLKKSGDQLDTSKAKIEKELATIRKVSADKIAIYEENQQLKNQLVSIRHELQGLEQENSSLQDNSTRDWFLIGAGVCILGILMGIMLPNMRLGRRQSSWGSL